MRRNHETCVEADYKIRGRASCAGILTNIPRIFGPMGAIFRLIEMLPQRNSITTASVRTQTVRVPALPQSILGRTDDAIEWGAR
jgi:hypothetical protein